MVFKAKYVIIKFKTLIRLVFRIISLKEAFSKGIFLKYIKTSKENIEKKIFKYTKNKGLKDA